MIEDYATIYLHYTNVESTCVGCQKAHLYEKHRTLIRSIHVPKQSDAENPPTVYFQLDCDKKGTCVKHLG